jgi:parafibromin
MATTGSTSDALSSLRQAIGANIHPILTTSSEAASVDNTTSELSRATHLQFHYPDNKQDIFPLSSSTRFETDGKPIDLRSVLFAWQRKDDAITDYISATRKLNENLPGGAGGSVQNLVFADRLDLISWLEGQSDESENIKPLAEDAAKAHAQAVGAAGIAAGATAGATAVSSGTTARAAGASDARLQEIYNGERKMGDRNSILRGIKPTVWNIGSTCWREADTI